MCKQVPATEGPRQARRATAQSGHPRLQDDAAELGRCDLAQLRNHSLPAADGEVDTRNDLVAAHRVGDRAGVGRSSHALGLPMFTQLMSPLGKMMDSPAFVSALQRKPAFDNWLQHPPWSSA